MLGTLGVDRNAVASSSCHGLLARTVATLLLVSAGCFAAVVAHVVIDLVGDFVLVRDAYDNAAHASRFIALALALSGGLAIVWHMLLSAVAEARGTRQLLRIAAERVVAGSAFWFVVRVTLVTIGILAVMGLLDARLDSLALEDIGDLFGGSSVVGLSVSLVAGTAVGSAVFRVIRWIGISHREIVAAVAAYILLIVRARRVVARARTRDRVRWFHRRPGALGRRAGKRAPPPLFT